MTNTISVPRELRQVLGTILNALDRDALEGKTVRGEMAQELRALLESPAVEVEGLEVVAWQDAENPAYTTSEIRIMEEWVLDGYPIVPLCSLPKAQAVIEQYKQDALRFRLFAETVVADCNGTTMTPQQAALFGCMNSVTNVTLGELSTMLDKAMKGEGDE